MQLNRITVLALAPLIAVAAEAATRSEKVEKIFSVPAGTSVSVSNVNGSIEVTSWDRPQIRLVAEKRVKAGSDSAAEEALSKLKIVIEHNRDTLSISTRYPRSSSGFFDWLTGNDVNAKVEYQLVVPRSMNTSLETVNGSVRVDRVHGQLRLETVNGRIEISKSGGNIEATTVNGSIDAELLHVVPASMTLETVNGGVDLALPDSTRADIDVRTVNGGISSDLPLTSMTSSKRQLVGQLNGGGPALDIRTVNGGVRIRQSN